MKKLISILLLFWCASVMGQTYNPSTSGISTNVPLAPGQSIPTDSRSMYYDPSFFKWRAYQSTSEVLTYLNLSKYREGKFDIYITTGGSLSGGTITGGVTTVWWFKDGTANENLVPKGNITSVNGQTTGNVVVKNADSLKSFPLDTTVRRNNYVVTFDSVARKFYLSEKGGGTTLTAGTGIDITANVIRALNENPLWNANQLRGRSISTTAPNVNQALVWNGIQYAPSNITGIDTVYFSGQYFYVVASGDTTQTLVTGLDLNVNSVHVEAQSGYNGDIPLDDLQNRSWVSKQNMQEAFDTWTANATVNTDDYTIIGENTLDDRIRVDTAEGKIATQTMLATAGGSYALSRTPGRDSIDLLRNGLVISTVKDSAASPGSGITSVTRDGTLVNDGTGGSPLGVDTSAGKIATKTDIALIAPTYPDIQPGQGIEIGGTPEAPIIVNTVHKITDSTLYVNGDTLKIGSSLSGYIIENVLTNNPGHIPSSQATFNAIVSSGSSEVVQITVSNLNVSIGLATNKIYAITDDGRQGFFYYAGTVADQTSENFGTVIVTADLKQYKRIYSSWLDIRWFGGKADAVITGVTQSGTDNSVPINDATAAAKENEVVYVAAGRYYLANSITWGAGKANSMLVDGNIYTNGKTFLTVQETQVQHKATFNGAIYGKTNLGNDKYIDWLNKTGVYSLSGNNFASLTGSALHLVNAHKGRFVFNNQVEGFASAIRISGSSVGDYGEQETIISFNQLRKNRVGILYESLTGNTYVDKNTVFGGRISADTAIKFDGNVTTATGVNKTGAFTHNRFNNVLTENCATGIFIDGVAKYTKFLGCSMEAGNEESSDPTQRTGVFGPTKVWITNSGARDNSFIGEEYVFNDWFGNGVTTGMTGTNLSLSSSSVVTRIGGSTLGTMALGGATGRVTVLGGSPIGFTARGYIPSYMDVMTIGNGRSEDSRTTVAGYAKIEGVERYLGWRGQFLNVTNQSGDTINMPPNCNYVRMAHASNKVIRINSGDLNIPIPVFAEGFKIELVGPGLPTFVRGDNNTVVIPSSYFTGLAGAKFQVDFRSNGFSYYRDDDTNGGGGSGGGTFVTSGINSYTNGSVGIGINPATYYARYMSGASTTSLALMEFPTSSVYNTVLRDGAWDFNGVKYRIGIAGIPETIATDYNSMTFVNKTWQGFPIGIGYWATTGGLRNQMARVNAAGTGMEFAYSFGGTTTITGSSYTVLPGDQWVVCNAASGTVTVTMPTASSFNGRRITIRNKNAGSTVTISGGDPNTTNSLAAGQAAITYWSDGTTWLIESKF